MNKLILLILTLLMVQAAGFCQAAPQTNQPVSGPVKKYYNSTDAEMGYLNKPWNGDDTAFANLRRQVEREQQNGSLDAYLTTARKEYTADPSSHTAQFTYFYGIWLNKWANGVRYSYDDDINQSNFLSTSNLSQFPATYNFARMLVLSSELWAMGIRMLPVIERLVKADPKDTMGRYLLQSTLCSTDDPALQERGIQLATVLAAEYHDNARLQASLGYAYMQRWRLTKDPIMQQKAIDGYERYLALAKPNEYFRQVAQLAIRVLQGKQ